MLSFMRSGGRIHSSVIWILLLQFGCLSVVTSHQLFDEGKEYKYSYFGLFTTGTEEPVSYASSYMLIGMLRVQGNGGNTMTAKLEGMKMAVYNGRWGYFPIPQFGFFDDERLSTLENTFKIVLTEEGAFKTLIMNDQEPEFASNIKRGIATYLQSNLTGGFDSMQIFKENEMTTMGECPTAYEVTPPSPTSKFATIGKFRNHADCPDIPKRTRYGTRGYYQCVTDNTRDIFNSTSYATYEIDLNDKNPTINKVTIFSSILYWPFTSGRQYLYTWFNVTLALLDASPIQTPLPGPENAENHEDLAFVFEQSDYQDPEEETPDLKTVEPYYFHQTASETDVEAMIAKVKEIVDDAAVSFNTSLDDFNQDFHSNSPLTMSKALSYLDHDSLTLLYKYYSSQAKENPGKEVHLQLYIDGLVLAGTSATTLVLRDIIVDDFQNEWKLSRIVPLFPNYIRTPSEALVKEFDTPFDLLKNPKISNSTKRMLEFSLASLVSRGCERNLCATTGILDKYINYFENKLAESTHFGEQTTAVLGLRNIQIGRSLDKLVDIALGVTPVLRIVRVQAIWSLRPLFSKDPVKTTQKLLQVFYNRTESCEIRTSMFGLIMTTHPTEQVLHEIAYFMWSETCPQTLNIVRSTLTHMSKATGPCSKISSYARTILRYLPPGAIDPTRTTSYEIGYFDEAHGIGKSMYMTVQKTGSTALPTSIYFGSSYTIGGYSATPMGIFIRIDGLGKFLPDNILSALNNDTPQKILKILGDLKVKAKVTTPLRLEITIMYLNRAIYHYAGDEETLRLSVGKAGKQAEGFIKTLQKPSIFNNIWGRSVLLGETLYEQPLEVGIPVSIYTSGVQADLAKSKISVALQGQSTLETDADMAFKYHGFITTTISNHVPVFGTVHTVGLLRTYKIHQSLHTSFNLNMQGKLDEFTIYPPAPESPTAIQTHATAFTSLSSEHPLGQDGVDLLKKSCPNCQPYTWASSGPGIAQTGEIFSIPKFAKGVRSGVKKIMCERHISKARLLKRLQNFFSNEGKNTGIFDSAFAKFNLALQQGFDYFFLWPNPEPCGFQLYDTKNYANSSHVLEKITGSASFGVDQDRKKGHIQQINVDYNVTLTFGGTAKPPPETVSYHIEIVPEVEGSQELRGRVTVDGQPDGKVLVTCYEIQNYAAVPKSDPLGFSGDNEPGVNQSILVKVGKVTEAEKSTANCPNDQIDLIILAEAERSQEQILEATSPAKDLPSLLCQLEQASGNWPKDRMPPTPECFQVTLDQTGLRTVNMSVKYKVAEEVRKRWIQPLLFIGNLLSPFLVDPEHDKVHQQHQQDNHYEGQLKIDMNLKKQDPVMDIHFVGASEDRLYRDIDLDLLPNAFKFKPAPGRFAPSTQFMYQAGFLGSCALTPNNIVTFDNQKYSVKVSDCETLVAADCSEWPDFAVYAKTTASKKLSIRITLTRGEIEIDGDQVTCVGRDPIVFDDNGNFYHNHIGISKRGKEITVRWMSIFGIEVRYSGGDFIQVILGSRYRGLTCGLCGNFDTTPGNDMVGPTTPSCPLASIPQAWTVKSESCEKAESVC